VRLELPGEWPDLLNLPEGYLSGVWIVESRKVNLDDLIAAGSRPGAIVRVSDSEAIRYIPSPQDLFERVAGMISDAA